MLRDHRFCCGEIRAVIGSKTKICTAIGASCQCVKKANLHDPVFMMATFRPWVGEKHKYPVKKNLWGQRSDAFFSLGFEKDEVGQLRPVPFSHRPFHAVAE